MLNFPSSPINGQEYDNWVYNTAKGAWLAKPLEPMAAVPSPVAPSTPQPGDMWFNTNEATTYVYYDDGNTSQWVEMVAQTGLTSPLAVTQGGTGATTVAGAQDSLKVGLVNVVPTSVTVTGAGASASANTFGMVTVTSAATVSLDGIFSSKYRFYRMHIQGTNSVAGVDIQGRFRRSGADVSTGYFGMTRYTHFNGANGTAGTRNNGVNGYLNSQGVNLGSVWVDISPNSNHPQYSFNAVTPDLGWTLNGGYWTPGAAATGFTVYPSSGAWSGTIHVYAFNE